MIQKLGAFEKVPQTPKTSPRKCGMAVPYHLLIESLSQLRDPETGEQVTKAAYRREEIYTGPYVNNAPDIVLLQESYDVSHKFMSGDSQIYGRWAWRTGIHTMGGVFAAYGNHIKESVKISGTRIIDVAPTILRILKIKNSQEIDGKPIKEIIAD